ncbi:unnamed protein product [Lactuca saligna]|uniref:Uncharacterized protein n=1 Tax=Lactuca saligna TaxID=75948 RepID=A0AA35YBW8_LACSI|nr:unnamed protein product [Lactuca saligna]
MTIRSRMGHSGPDFVFGAFMVFRTPPKVKSLDSRNEMHCLYIWLIETFPTSSIVSSPIPVVIPGVVAYPKMRRLHAAEYECILNVTKWDNNIEEAYIRDNNIDDNEDGSPCDKFENNVEVNMNDFNANIDVHAEWVGWKKKNLVQEENYVGELNEVINNDVLLSGSSSDEGMAAQ